MTPPTTLLGRALYFVNVLGDTQPLCLDWTKVGLALSTSFTAVTGAVATVQSVIGTAAHTEWGLFASAVGLHGLSHGIARIKRHQEP
jgi:hypothetical protein